MNVINTFYNSREGKLYTKRTDGTLFPGSINYLDTLPPSGKPMWMTPDWINRFTERVNLALARTGGKWRMQNVGLSVSVEGEYRYEMIKVEPDGSMSNSVAETATNLAGVFQQNPGGWPAVDAYLDNLLGVEK